jgi:catechol 2,3-dioxygenase-like lactoylglutathione lyase family enzyme
MSATRAAPSVLAQSSPRSDSRRGLHHLGYLVDDMDQASAKVEANGAVRHGGIVNSEHGTETERKYRDPNGQVFDLTSPEYARDF